MTIILAIIGLLLIILEAITVSTFFIWLGIGFLGAAIIAYFTSNVLIIVLGGIIITLLSVMVFKPRYLKSIQPNGSVKTSYNQLVGSTVKMLEDYDYDGTNTATAIVKSITWTVEAKQMNASFKKDELVVVKAIDGAKLIIEKGV